MLNLGRPAWHAQSNCHGQSDLMFDGDEDQAVHVCDGCIVRTECLAAALVRKEPDGVWGGFTTDERMLIVKADPKEIPALLRHFASRRSSNPAR